MSEDNQASGQEPEQGKVESGSRWQELYKAEDYWAIWLGLAIIGAGLLIFLPNPPEGMKETIEKSNATMATEADTAPFRTIAWYKAGDAKKKLKATSGDLPAFLAKLTGKPHGWKKNPAESFVVNDSLAAEKKASAQKKHDAKQQEADTLFDQAEVAEDAAREASFQDNALNEEAAGAITQWRNAKSAASATSKKLKKAKAVNQVGYLALLGVAMIAIFGIGVRFMGNSVGKFALGFVFVFLIAVLSQLFAAQANLKDFGLGYALWAILFALLISNTIGTPRWVMPAVQTEYFIKTGLVLLGAEILFSKIVTIGIPGIFVAWFVTPVVLITTYIFGQKVLKIPSKTLNITISSDMSVCGVSAAIATAAAVFMIGGAIVLAHVKTKTLQDTATIIGSLLGGGLLGMYLLGFLTDKGDARAVWIGIACTILFTGWTILVQREMAPRWLSAPFDLYYTRIIGNLVMFVVGYVFGCLLPRRERALENLTVWHQDAAPLD